MSALKMLHIGFYTLATERAFDVIPSQDPAVSLRLYLPVSNWMNRKGDNVRRQFKHPRVVCDATGRFVFRFKNPKDKSLQEVAVDGTGAIALDGLKPADLTEMTKYILLETHGITALTPHDILKLFRWMHGTRHARVFQAMTQDAARQDWHPWNVNNPKILYGGFLPSPARSAAIGYRGPVTFELGDGQSKVFKDEGFVFFPGIGAGAVRMAGKDGLFALCANAGITPQVMDLKTLSLGRSLPDKKFIPRPTFRPWFRTPPKVI